MRIRGTVSIALIASIALRIIAVWLIVLSATEATAAGVSTPLARPGQTATLLSNGETLIIGGEDTAGPTAAILVWDPRTGAARAVGTLNHPRAWHTATVLPNGAVLIFGGNGSDGALVQDAEVFDPARGVSELLGIGIPPRAFHTATLLLDGHVLIAGGLGNDGAPMASVVLWDSQSGGIATFAEQLVTPRYGQTATTLPNGMIMLSGGIDIGGTTVADTELIDVKAGRIVAGGGFVAPPLSGAELVASIPEDGATNVVPTQRIGLRFSTPLQVDSVTSETVSLLGRDGIVPVSIVVAEGGSLLFLTPSAALVSGRTYTLAVHGARDVSGTETAPTTIEFTIARSSTTGSAAEAQRPKTPASGDASSDTLPVEDEEWAPDARSPYATWRTGRAKSAWQTLPPLKAPNGMTASRARSSRSTGSRSLAWV
jgi:hypothetical protein